MAFHPIHTLFGIEKKRGVPLLPLRDMVIFPGIALPLLVSGKRSLSAVEAALKEEKLLFCVAQKDTSKEEPEEKDLYRVGTIGKIRDLEKTQDGSIRILIEGIMRAKLLEIVQEEPFFKGEIESFPPPEVKKTKKIEALMYAVLNQFREIVSLGAPVPANVLFVILHITDPWVLADLIATHLDFKVPEWQNVLEAENVEEKLEQVQQALNRQKEVLKTAQKLQQEVGKEIGKMEKEMFLREQLKAIEKELGMIGGRSEVEELREKIEKAGMPEAIKKEALTELSRMERMPSFSPEISYIRTYLDWLIKLPWIKKDESKIDVKKAQQVLDEDHYGLEKVKERMIEYLAVQKLVGKIKGPILCFVGPPGTGKTSIGQSIARSLGRKFVRMSLGGIRDEADIRGFRRTYVGALPGRIIQGITNAGTKNPVFMLDEVDKIGFDAFHGDPASALLEALDPEQNNSFVDHYLEVPFDLSDTMFITTANFLDPIPPALKDRMEIIEFPGYTEEEKYWIAKKFLIPKQMKNHGLGEKQVNFTDAGIRTMIREYTLEAGVRELERSIAAVLRKIARRVAEGKEISSIAIGIQELQNFLGPAKYHITLAEKKDEVGVAAGLAFTPAGGDVLFIEATKMPGKGRLILTGHLGKVMQESAQAAYSYARSRASQLGIHEVFYKNSDLHVHVPSGAIPKDGPSAGIAMTVALVSVITNQPVRKDVAMTGEITLRGRVIEIGGVKEKVLAAHRSGIRTVILPKDNQKDLVDIPKHAKEEMKFQFVENMDEAIGLALLKTPKAFQPRPNGRKKKLIKAVRNT